MPTTHSARLNQLVALAALLEIPAVAIKRELHRRLAPAPRSRGGTLRPGAETPFWLALVEAVRPFLRQRGAKSQLARILGVDPSRISEFFVTTTAMPDAERTLFLLLWLAERRSGRLKQ